MHSNYKAMKSFTSATVTVCINEYFNSMGYYQVCKPELFNWQPAINLTNIEIEMLYVEFTILHNENE